MKQFFYLALLILVFGSGYELSAQGRTDGPPRSGSEFDRSLWRGGELQLGLQFGASFRRGSGSGQSLAAGADIDVRPYELFGLRASYLHAFTKHKAQLLFLSPLIHTEVSNFRPYLAFGPGLARVRREAESSKLRFATAATAGADVMLTTRLGIGMLYQYALVFDGPDHHHIGARFVFSWGGPGGW